MSETSVISALVHHAMGPLFKVIKDRSCMLINVSRDSDSMKDNLSMLAASMDDQVKSLAGRRIPSTAVDDLYNSKVRELTHDMEDCIERFLHRVTCAKGASRGRRLARFLRTISARYRFGSEIRALNRRLDELNVARRLVFEQALLNALNAGPVLKLPLPEDDEADDQHLDDPNPVGIELPKRELLGMLEDTPAELRVIAIVGFDGSGKTTLARAVFDCREVVHERFGRAGRAWVDQARDKNAREILQSLLDQFIVEVEHGLDFRALAGELKRHLRSNRCLIVIDDIRKGQWNTIKWAFQDNSEGNSQQQDSFSSSRIIVTTAIRSEANSCCSNGNGFIYQMQNHGHQHCQRIALREVPPDDLLEHSTELLKKCDGHPLSLVSVANHLFRQIEPTGQCCEEMSINLGSLLEKDPDFGGLNSVCMDNYTSLSNETVRACLLYLSIFPKDVPLEREVIIRRWLAEGYARSQNVSSDERVAQENFQTFVTRDILHPIISMCKNAEVKTCKTRGIVHVFALHRSLNQRFIMCGDGENRRGRHLSIDHRNGADEDDGTTTAGMDLSRVRSLTVFGSAGNAISMLHKYKILRVLDLEECNDVTDRDLKHIRKLWNLRYLSLGSEITTIPRDVARLKLLETLCLRKTKVEELPVQVFALPCLVHLIGKFKIIQDHGCSSTELKNVLVMSKLETLSGFVADESQEFLNIFCNMRKLKKVKIWCQSAEHGNLPDWFSKPIQKYMDMAHHHHSLSIHLQGFSGNFMSSLKATSYLSSLKLKLHGEINTISPVFVSPFSDLVEVCLSSTILTKDLLTALSGLQSLLYLKLIAAGSRDELVVQNGAFRNLRRFCIKVKISPLLTIGQGALPKLVSLQLLCGCLNGMAGIQIEYLVNLMEVTLEASVIAETKSTWEEQANMHPNRPKILYTYANDQEDF